MSLQAPAAAEAKLQHPPLPPPRLRVGVTGHRAGSKLLDAHVAAVTAQITQVLDSIASESRRVFGGGCEARRLAAPELVVISALASGADQLVARAALQQEWQLEAVLPFRRNDYANDMQGSALAEFHSLLAASSS